MRGRNTTEQFFNKKGEWYDEFRDKNFDHKADNSSGVNVDKFGAVDKQGWKDKINAKPNISTGGVFKPSINDVGMRDKEFMDTEDPMGIRGEQREQIGTVTVDNTADKKAELESVDRWFNKIDNAAPQAKLNSLILRNNAMNDNQATVRTNVVKGNDRDDELELSGASGKKKRTGASMSTSLGV